MSLSGNPADDGGDSCTTAMVGNAPGWMVKNKFKASYKDIDDDKFDEIIKYIEFLKQNPS